MKLNRKSWPETVVVNIQPFTGRNYIENIEVVYDPIDRLYVPLEKRAKSNNSYTEYDLREVK